MAFTHALIMFINAKDTDAPEYEEITFIFSDDLEYSDISIGYAPSGMFDGMRPGEYAYISGDVNKKGYLFISELFLIGGKIIWQM